MNAGDVFGGYEIIGLPAWRGTYRVVPVRCRGCGAESVRAQDGVSKNRLGCRACARRFGRTRQIDVPPGTRYGRWTVVRETSEAGCPRVFLCHCECGRERPVTLGNLRSGMSRGCQSCGASKPESECVTKHPLHQTWAGMRGRCYNTNAPSFARYGALGVSVCDRWRNDFAAFLVDMGPRPDGTSLDRIDPCGNYEPGNCRWADRFTQARNKRDDRRHVVDGARLTLQEMADRVGVSRQAVQQRIKWGWTPEEAASLERGDSPLRQRTTRPRGRPRTACHTNGPAGLAALLGSHRL